MAFDYHYCLFFFDRWPLITTIVCPSLIDGLWLPLWYLLFTASDYHFGILDLRPLITTLVSKIYGLWLPLWYLFLDSMKWWWCPPYTRPTRNWILIVNSSLKQLSAGKQVLGILSWCRANQYLLSLLKPTYHKSSKYLFYSPLFDLNPRSILLQVSSLTITPQIRYLTWFCYKFKLFSVGICLYIYEHGKIYIFSTQLLHRYYTCVSLLRNTLADILSI